MKSPVAGTGIRRLLRLVTGAGDVERAVDDEIAFHMDETIRELESLGRTPDEARAEAMGRFGDVRRTREGLIRFGRASLGAEQRRDFGDALLHDVSSAWRAVRRSPGISVAVIVTLALGIGANATIFGVVDRLLLRGPDHVVDAGQVGRFYFTRRAPGMGEFTTFAAGQATLTDLRTAPAIAWAAGYSPAQVTVGRGAAARSVPATYVSADFFPLLGVKPFRGRFFTADEDLPPAGQQVAVIGYEFWRSLGSDSALLGSTLTFDSKPFTILGIAPPGFTGVELERSDIWLPMSILGARVTSDGWTTTRNSQWMRIVGRAREGVPKAAVADQATAAHRRGVATSPLEGPERAQELAATVALRTLLSDSEGREAREVSVSRLLAGVALAVLLVACANVANLLLTRALQRRRELAVRLALGISRVRLVRVLLLESLMLALSGGAAALAFAVAGGQLVRRVLLPDISWPDQLIGARLLAFTFGVAAFTALAVGLLPALQASRDRFASWLKAGVREGGAQHGRLRASLLIVQAALSVVLLVGAGLFVRSLRDARSVPLGIAASQVLDARVYSRAGGWDRVRTDLFYDRAVEHLSGLPWVEHAAITVGMPFSSRFTVSLRIPEHDSLPRLGGGGPYIQAVSPGYFAAAGTRLLQGRAFESSDTRLSEPVTVVSETMARTLWPGRDALTRCMYVARSENCARVVGVVEDVRRDQLREEPAMQFYVPLQQKPAQIGGPRLLVRPRGPAEQQISALRGELLRLEPEAPYIDIELVARSVDPLFRPWTLGATLFGLFGALALLVAAVGLYSTLSYSVASRAHEMGVRAALGASSADIRRLVVTSGLRVTVIGVIAGSILALMAGSFLQGVLFETSPRDIGVFSGVVITLMGTALVACLLPARRAAKVDPSSVLRSD